MPQPLVAIQVLNYNGLELTARCLDSLLALEYSEKTITVIDNGSTDGSLEALKRRYPSIHFFENGRNLGFGAGHNVGIRSALKAGAAYVWLVNQDAWVDPQALVSLVEACEADARVGAVSPLVLSPDQSVWFAGARIRWIRMRVTHIRRTISRRPYPTESLSGCAPLLVRSALERAGMFDERYFLYYEDADLSCRFQRAGYRLMVDPQARIFHEERSNTDNPEKLYWLVRSGIQFFRTHTPSSVRLPQRLFLFLRQAKNRIDRTLFPRSESVRQVARAYRDSSL